MLNKIADKLQQQDKVIQLIQKPNPENNSNNHKKTNNQQTKSKRYFLTLFLYLTFFTIGTWQSCIQFICVNADSTDKQQHFAFFFRTK